MAVGRQRGRERAYRTGVAAVYCLARILGARILQRRHELYRTRAAQEQERHSIGTRSGPAQRGLSGALTGRARTSAGIFARKPDRLSRKWGKSRYGKRPALAGESGSGEESL